MISAVDARAVCQEGLLIAVEPRSRPRDILGINLALNARCHSRIIEVAIMAEDDEPVRLNRGPPPHSGGSSLVRAFRSGGRRQVVVGRSAVVSI